MTELETYLEAIEPDLRNVTRLFSLSDEEAARFTYHMAEENGCYVCEFTSGERTARGSASIPQDEDSRLRALHRKRAARRLCKQTLYQLCREVTGIHPPWGSLTGVRPTHLIWEALSAGMTLEEAIVHVQRQFDVSEEKAQLLGEVVERQLQLPAPDDRFMDVYIGIPFCTTRCAYCSFSSGELGDGHMVEPYLHALFQEMEAAVRLLSATGRTLRAVYVGGGTPTALDEGQLTRLLDKLMLLFPGACEYTVEAGRPDTITAGKLRAIQQAGVSRISINPQTMNDQTLRIIGRAHTSQQVYDAYDLARQAGIHHINMDVIAGLPGETEADFAATMAAARALHPESLTVHTLALKRSSRMHLENAPLPSGEIASHMVLMGQETAAQLGMRPYYLYRQKYMAGNQENVGYALPAHACQYNVDIMEETTHILALGAGAISKRVYPDEGHIARSPNVSNIHQYIDRITEMITRKEDLFRT